MRRGVWGAVGALLLAFALGAASGGLGVQWRILHDMRAQIEQGPPGQLPARVRRVLLEKGLNLTQEQGEKLLAIFVASGDELERLRRPLEPQAAPIRWRERAQVRALLTPEQHVTYDRNVRALDESLGRLPEPP